MLNRSVSSLVVLMLAILLSGCAIPLLPDIQQPQQFGVALDQYLTQSDLTALETLAAQQPASVWSQRANALAYQLKQQRLQLSKEQQRFDQTQQQHKLCQQENTDLKETMEQLKQLLIEMELRE